MKTEKPIPVVNWSLLSKDNLANLKSENVLKSLEVSYCYKPKAGFAWLLLEKKKKKNRIKKEVMVVCLWVTYREISSVTTLINCRGWEPISHQALFPQWLCQCMVVISQDEANEARKWNALPQDTEPVNVKQKV